jgi:hypothetical protein
MAVAVGKGPDCFVDIHGIVGCCVIYVQSVWLARVGVFVSISFSQ